MNVLNLLKFKIDYMFFFYGRQDTGEVKLEVDKSDCRFQSIITEEHDSVFSEAVGMHQ